MSGFDSPAVQLGFWTIVVGIVGNVSCALLGCFLVLRRLSMLGDAISHAVLPGIALAFLLSGQLIGWPIFVGALLLGMLTAFLTQAVHELAGVPEDSSMGVVFTALFALGVLLISNIAQHADLDAGCVLYGLIEFVPLDTVRIAGLEVPRALQTMLPVLLLTIGFLALFWKELQVAAFDPSLATAMGFSASLLHYALMALVAGVTVTAFEAVGAILVVAMLIVPAAAAHLLTDRLAWMLVWSAAIAALSAVLGYFAAVWLDTSVAGMMTVAAGGLFALALAFAPRHGLMSRLVRRLRLTVRIAREDVLSNLYRHEEAASPERERVPVWLERLAVWQLRRWGWIESTPTGWYLTDAGRGPAESLVRAHRLWEAYLDTHFQLPLDHLHQPAQVMEHYIGPQLQGELAAEMQNPSSDPHGHQIPRT